MRAFLAAGRGRRKVRRFGFLRAKNLPAEPFVGRPGESDETHTESHFSRFSAEEVNGTGEADEVNEPAESRRRRAGGGWQGKSYIATATNSRSPLHYLNAAAKLGFLSLSRTSRGPVSDHPIIRMWEATRDSFRPGHEAHPRPDHLKRGVDYLSLVSGSDFETFMMNQLGNEEVQKRLGFRDVLGWLTSSDSNLPSSALQIKDIDLHQPGKFPVFIDRLRRSIWDAIADLVINCRKEHLVPESGTLLYFTTELRYSYVINYHLHFERPVIEILDRIENPRGICDLEDIGHLRTQRARNWAKNYLTSAHKIIVQNGVLTHVDRRYDKNVFGPTIDTILLAKIIFGTDDLRSDTSFLEIGSGSGHLSATAAATLLDGKTFVAVDISEYATSCTVRNMRTNLRYHKSMDLKDLHEFMVIFGSFRKNNFTHKYDLVVSNPPYIARRDPQGDVFAERFTEAVAGTELIASIFEALPSLLTARGKLLVMLSSVTGDPTQLPIPDGFELRSALPPELSDGLEVPFDVEEVLDQKEWVADLLGRQEIWQQADGGYTHRLRPVWIERSK